MPSLTGQSFGKAIERLESAKLTYRTIGTGDTVTNQLPKAGSTLASGTQVIVYLGTEPSTEQENMPDVTGMSYNQARDTLSYYGIYIQTISPVLDGDRQLVSSQSIAGGTLVDHGTVVAVSLISDDDSMLGKY